MEIIATKPRQAGRPGKEVRIEIVSGGVLVFVLQTQKEVTP